MWLLLTPHSTQAGPGPTRSVREDIASRCGGAVAWSGTDQTLAIRMAKGEMKDPVGPKAVARLSNRHPSIQPIAGNLITSIDRG